MKNILVLFLIAVLKGHAEETNHPITFQYVKTGESNNGGYITSGTIFWATNHTTNTLAVDLRAIEVKTSSNWITQSRQLQPLIFQQSGKPITQPFLDPHTAGYATIQLSTQPTGTTWRAKVTVQAALTGIADTAARIRHYPELMQRRLRSGDTNIPANPFATNVTYFGKVTEILSQEISDE